MKKPGKGTKKGIYKTERDLTYRMSYLADEFLGSQSEDIEFTAMDIYENSDYIFVEVEMAGISPNDVKVHVKGDKLFIKGVKYETEQSSREITFHCAERSFGAFRRVFVLGSAVDSENIDANYKNGILLLKIAKMKELERPSHSIEVKIDE